MNFIERLNALSQCIADKSEELGMDNNECLAALYLCCDMRKVGFARDMHSQYARLAQKTTGNETT